MVPLSALLPSWLELAGLCGVVVAGLVLMLCGRAFVRCRGTPELQLMAGWGGYALALTLWGVATTRTMAIPTTAAILLAGGVLALPGWRPTRADWLGIARVMALSLPIWAIMAAVKPALPDTFTNFLPNAVYLFDHGFFPADDRAHAFATWPAFPYNVQLATYLASFPLPQFPPGALTHFNILLQVMTGLLFARQLRPRGGDLAAAPSWAACAGGLLLVTLLNPGFVPRIDFTSYAEPALTVMVAILGWLAAELLGAAAEGRKSKGALGLFTLILVVLVGIKQVGIVLAFGLGLGAMILVLADRRIDRRAAVTGLALAAVPALALYGLWRGYVMTHFVSGELKLLPPEHWQFEILPGTIASIVEAIWEKPVYFGAMLAVIALAVVLCRREGLTQRTRLLLLTIVLFAVYNAFLLLIYVIHMGVVAGEAAHSYFRYMTHLSLMMTLALTITARAWWLERPAGRVSAAWRLVPPLVVALILVAPVGFMKRLRFDLQMPQPLLWELARNIAGAVKDGDRIALLMPGDNGSDSLMLRAALELVPPRRRNLEIFDVSSVPGGLEAAAAHGYDRAVVSCVEGAAAPEAALMVQDGGTWRIETVWPHAPVRGKERWTGVLSAAPLCRKD